MKLTLKTLNRTTVYIEVDTKKTVLELKQLVAAKKEVNIEVESLQLIYNGSIMKDEDALSVYELDEDKFIVLMSKKTPVPQSTATAAAVPAAAAPILSPTQAARIAEITQSLPMPPKTTTVTAPTTTATTTTTSNAVQPPSPTETEQSRPQEGGNAVPTATPSIVPDEQRVRDLMNMGYAEQEVRDALRASFNHPERAIEYLITGIPENLTDGEQPPTATASAASTASTVSANTDTNSQTSSVALAELANDPRFQHMRSLIQQNPELLAVALAQLNQINPDLFDLIRDNQNEFVQLLNQNEDVHFEAPELSEDDEVAVDRLCALGFDRNRVIQAYIACNRDEYLTADFLFRETEEDD